MTDTTPPDAPPTAEELLAWKALDDERYTEAHRARWARLVARLEQEQAIRERQGALILAVELVLMDARAPSDGELAERIASIINAERASRRAAEERARTAEEAPHDCVHFFKLRAADALADVIEDWVQRKVIDARSALAETTRERNRLREIETAARDYIAAYMAPGGEAAAPAELNTFRRLRAVLSAPPTPDAAGAGEEQDANTKR